MGSKPKKKDYQPTAADRASASVAMAQYRYFKEKYDPLLQQMRDKAATGDGAKKTLRGRGNADTMQALTAPSYQRAQNISTAGDMAQAYQGQLGVANRSAKDIENMMKTNVLKSARKQAATAQTGMAQAARLSTSDALARAKNNQDVAQAKLNAAAQIGTAGLAKGYDNYQSTGSVFSSEGIARDANGNPIKLKDGTFKTENQTLGSLFGRG